MKRTIAALACLSALAACSSDPEDLDPTQRHDYACYRVYAEETACAQLRITTAEAIAGLNACEDPGGIDGSWESDACADTIVEGMDTLDRSLGHCLVEASEYSFSGTDVKLYFYGLPDEELAEAACLAADEDNDWVPGT